MPAEADAVNRPSRDASQVSTELGFRCLPRMSEVSAERRHFLARRIVRTEAPVVAGHQADVKFAHSYRDGRGSSEETSFSTSPFLAAV